MGKEPKPFYSRWRILRMRLRDRYSNWARTCELLAQYLETPGARRDDALALFHKALQDRIDRGLNVSEAP